MLSNILSNIFNQSISPNLNNAEQHFEHSLENAFGDVDVFDVDDVVDELPLHVPVEPRDDEVPIILVFHQLLDAGEFQPTHALAFQNPVDHFLQKMLVFAEKEGKRSLSQPMPWPSRILSITKKKMLVFAEKEGMKRV